MKDTTELKELQGALGNQFDDFFPEGIDGIIERETFQSETFREAGYHCMPERYGKGDRFLYTIRQDDGRITFVMTGKVSSGNPYEVGHAADALLDLRKDLTVVYQYNGNETIRETILSNGQENIYQGEYGKPDALLSYIKPTLGKKVE